MSGGRGQKVPILRAGVGKGAGHLGGQKCSLLEIVGHQVCLGKLSPGDVW
jgi:hypothetical protein